MKLAWFYMYVNAKVFGHPFGFSGSPRVALYKREPRFLPVFRKPYISEPYGPLRRVTAVDLRKYEVEGLSFDTATAEREVHEAISAALRFAEAVKGVIAVAEAHEDAELGDVQFKTSVSSLLESRDRLPGSAVVICALAKDRVVRVDFRFTEQLEEPKRELLYLARSRDGLLHYVYALNPRVVRWSGGGWTPL